MPGKKRIPPNEELKALFKKYVDKYIKIKEAHVKNDIWIGNKFIDYMAECLERLKELIPRELETIPFSENWEALLMAHKDPI